MLQVLLMVFILLILAAFAVLIVKSNENKKVTPKRVEANHRQLESQAVFIQVSPERLKEIKNS